MWLLDNEKLVPIIKKLILVELTYNGPIELNLIVGEYPTRL